MNSTPDPSSFAARRSAASNLPTFQLPPPPELPPMQKFSTFAGGNVPQPLPVSAGNLLTPPSTLSGDALSPVFSGLHSGSSASSNAGVAPYTPLCFWPPTAQAGSSYGFSPGAAPPSAFAGPNPAAVQSRGAFSPSLSSMLRRGNSVGECLPLPPPPYDLSLPPFPTSNSFSGPSSSGSTGLPNLAMAPQAMAHAFMNQSTPPSAAAAQPSPVHPPGEPFVGQRPLPTPSYYTQHRPHPASAPAHQTTFPPSITAASPPQQSPGSTVSAPRLMPNSPLAHQISLAQRTPGPAAPPPTRALRYSMGAMPGPLVSNPHSVGSQFSLVGGVPGGLMAGYAGHLSHPYGASLRHSPAHLHAATAPPQNDRPFKCDQCPQSFNRNHDLKRHKRIHLAVKPFPCRHCDKSFSRKDALKRHILVKGCGKTPQPSDSIEIKDDGSVSPYDHSRGMSGDDGGDDPTPSDDGGGSDGIMRGGLRMPSI